MDGVVFTVRVVAEFDELGVTEHVGAPVGNGSTEQVNETELLKVPIAVMFTLAEADCPALTVLGVNADDDNEKSAVTSSLKVAVTDRSVFMVTTQEPGPEHAPLQPAKVDPAEALAVRVTIVPPAKTTEHELEMGQSIPPGLPTMLPLPPVLVLAVTLRVKAGMPLLFKRTPTVLLAAFTKTRSNALS